MITLKPGDTLPGSGGRVRVMHASEPCGQAITLDLSEPPPHKPGDSYGSGRVVHVDGNGNPIVLFPGRDSPFELRTMPKRGKST